MEKNTGNESVVLIRALAGVAMFKVRQSSLALPDFANLACGQGGPKFLADRVPFRGATGWGGFHRRGPMGGRA